MTDSLSQATLTGRAILAGSEALAGRRRGLGSLLPFAGPAVMASVAYMDPGNFATNLQGGAKFGYLLLWVVLLANLMAMLIQYLSAKLGIVTDLNYPEVVRAKYHRAFTFGMWVQAEIMAMSTDIAEFLGAAIGLNLLFGVPLFVAGLMTGAIAFGILALQALGFRKFELAISALLGIIFAGFLYETLRIGPSVHKSLHGLIPGLQGGTTELYIAVGIVGATRAGGARADAECWRPEPRRGHAHRHARGCRDRAFDEGAAAARGVHAPSGGGALAL